MKLLFPIFASLMLQSQVTTELLGLKKCLMGLGTCKDHCAIDEKEVQKCKKKKCCIGPKVVQMIKDYLISEMANTFNDNSKELPNPMKDSNVIQAKYHLASLLQIKSSKPFADIITSKSNSGKSAAAKPMISGKITYTKSDAKDSRDSVSDYPPTLDLDNTKLEEAYDMNCGSFP
ncbi:beta-defensin 129 [Erinaceus europaeus]|uniref:Beta-defensin 129 n=1 Tax=Erinaceus europaeus TaxID=9365 RepID=A0A1S2ZQW8_ERIEU|nr:beta-defensin 129 [Erinaceus europaeus]